MRIIDVVKDFLFSSLEKNTPESMVENCIYKEIKTNHKVHKKRGPKPKIKPDDVEYHPEILYLINKDSAEYINFVEI